MRLSVGSLRQVVKRDLPIEFVPQQLTSYGGLELLHRYGRRLGLYPRLRRACAELGGDYGGARLSLLLLALFCVGARRGEHLKYLVGDPLVRRFCGLARLPTAHTVTNWLRRFTHATLRPLVQLNQDLVLDTLARLDVPRLTLDVDGTVVRTGATVAWAFRGFNPHHRKDLSHYPLVAHVAQTGHILRLKNPPGNVHDSKQSVAFLRELIEPCGRGWAGGSRWSSAWTPRFSSATCCACSSPAGAPPPSRSATGAGCPSSTSRPSGGRGTRWRPT
jgi:Transposase DDE domain group 1